MSRRTHGALTPRAGGGASTPTFPQAYSAGQVTRAAYELTTAPVPVPGTECRPYARRSPLGPANGEPTGGPPPGSVVRMPSRSAIGTRYGAPGRGNGESAEVGLRADVIARESWRPRPYGAVSGSVGTQGQEQTDKDGEERIGNHTRVEGCPTIGTKWIKRFRNGRFALFALAESLPVQGCVK
jgi:hypothetical protein